MLCEAHGNPKRDGLISMSTSQTQLREVNQLAQGHTAWERFLRLPKGCYVICEKICVMSRFKRSCNVASSGEWTRSGGEDYREVVSSGQVNPRRLPGGIVSEGVWAIDK